MATTRRPKRPTANIGSRHASPPSPPATNGARRRRAITPPNDALAADLAAKSKKLNTTPGKLQLAFAVKVNDAENLLHCARAPRTQVDDSEDEEVLIEIEESVRLPFKKRSRTAVRDSEDEEFIPGEAKKPKKRRQKQPSEFVTTNEEPDPNPWQTFKDTLSDKRPRNESNYAEEFAENFLADANWDELEELDNDDSEDDEGNAEDEEDADDERNADDEEDANRIDRSRYQTKSGKKYRARGQNTFHHPSNFEMLNIGDPTESAWSSWPKKPSKQANQFRAKLAHAVKQRFDERKRDPKGVAAWVTRLWKTEEELIDDMMQYVPYEVAHRLGQPGFS